LYLSWQKKYWDSQSKLNDLRPVIDLDDCNGYKNEKYNRIHQRALKKIFRKICPKGSEYLLDYGCGVGRNFNFLLNKSRNYIGVDISPGMLEKAKGDKCLIDGERLPFENNCFDMIFNFLEEYLDEETYTYVTDLKKIAVRYIKGKFIYDLIAWLPFQFMINIQLNKLLRLLKLLRLPRLL